MRCCRGVMEPIAPSGCCTPMVVGVATERDVRCGIVYAHRLEGR